MLPPLVTKTKTLCIIALYKSSTTWRVENLSQIPCPKCEQRDDPRWKPYFWHLYWEYAAAQDFSDLIPAQLEKKYCEAGDFYYHFENDFYYFKVGGKTRKILYRFPKGKESMVNKKLFEKTPSEKGFMNDRLQRRLIV